MGVGISLHAVTSRLIKSAVFCGAMPSPACALGVTSVLDCMAAIMIVRAEMCMDYFECT